MTLKLRQIDLRNKSASASTRINLANRDNTAEVMGQGGDVKAGWSLEILTKVRFDH
jgi:hypothetical protein